MRQVLMVVLPLGVTLAFVPGWVSWPPGSLGPVLIAAILYSGAHAVRALRLALLGAPALQVSVRSLVLLHFYTAPMSFAVPLKLGEIFRLYQLVGLARDAGGAVVVLLLERSLDAVVLLLALFGVLIAGRSLPQDAWLLALVLGPVVVLGGLVVLLAPGGLAAVQAYMLRHHSRPWSLRLLHLVHAARMTTGRAHALVREWGLELLLLSCVIWSLESAVLAILANVLELEGPAALAWLRAWPGHYVTVGYWTLMLIWPVAASLFLQRVELPPRRMTSLEPARAGVRRIRLAGRRL